MGVCLYPEAQPVTECGSPRRKPGFLLCPECHPVSCGSLFSSTLEMYNRGAGHLANRYTTSKATKAGASHPTRSVLYLLVPLHRENETTGDAAVHTKGC